MLTATQAVLLFSAMTIGIIALLLLTLAREHTKHIQGFAEWGAGLLLISGSITGLFLARHILDSLPKALLGETLMLVGIFMCADGLRRFFNSPQPYPKWLITVLFIMFVSSTTWLSYIQPNTYARNIIFMTAGAAVVLDMLVVLYKHRKHGVGAYLLAATLILLLILRAISLRNSLPDTQHLDTSVNSGISQFVALVWPSLTLTIATVAFILMGSEKLARKLNQSIHNDDLTETLNKRSLHTEMAREIGRSIRYKHPLSVLVLDLDNFKAINDSLGHLKGDQILKEVAVQIGRSVRSTDLVARIGGDEFAVLLTESDITNSHIIATRILTNAKRALPEHCGINIGIASLRSPGETVDSLLHRAEQALYQAKTAGKNQFAVA